VIVFVSVLINRPFTEAYAKEQTPKEIWNSPAFRAFNRKISAVWGLALLVGTLSLILAGSTDSRQVLLRVIVPFGPWPGRTSTATEKAPRPKPPTLPVTLISPH
jgi:hypothetical protein